MTLQQTLTHLVDLAATHEAELTTPIQLELGGGATVSVFWTPTDDVPREGTCYFKEDGSFCWAFVVDPHIWLRAVDEGLSEEKATDAARRMVETPEALFAYLERKPYHYVGK